jgi:hypothetical protein
MILDESSSVPVNLQIQAFKRKCVIVESSRNVSSWNFQLSSLSLGEYQAIISAPDQKEHVLVSQIR